MFLVWAGNQLNKVQTATSVSASVSGGSNGSSYFSLFCVVWNCKSYAPLSGWSGTWVVVYTTVQLPKPLLCFFGYVFHMWEWTWCLCWFIHRIRIPVFQLSLLGCFPYAVWLPGSPLSHSSEGTPERWVSFSFSFHFVFSSAQLGSHLNGEIEEIKNGDTPQLFTYQGSSFLCPLSREMSFSIRALHDFDVAATENASPQFAGLEAQQKERGREEKREREIRTLPHTPQIAWI